MNDHSKSFLWTRNPREVQVLSACREDEGGERRVRSPREVHAGQTIRELAHCRTGNGQVTINKSGSVVSADRRQTDTGLERGPRARRPVRFYFVREDRRTYIQLGWAASDAFSRSSRSQGSNRGHMTLQSSVNIARDPVSLHRIVGACACGSLALVLYSLLSVAGPLTLPHWSAAGPSPSLSHREISLHADPRPAQPLHHYSTTDTVSSPSTARLSPYSGRGIRQPGESSEISITLL